MGAVQTRPQCNVCSALTARASAFAKVPRTHLPIPLAIPLQVLEAEENEARLDIVDQHQAEKRLLQTDLIQMLEHELVHGPTQQALPVEERYSQVQGALQEAEADLRYSLHYYEDMAVCGPRAPL